LAHLSRINSGGSATKCCQDFQFSKVIRCLPVKTDGYRSVNSDYRSINNGYRFFEFELSFRAVSSGFRRFTAGLPIPLVGENRFTVGKVNPAPSFGARLATGRAAPTASAAPRRGARACGRGWTPGPAAPTRVLPRWPAGHPN